MSLPKSEHDCVFFLQGTCNKTDCEYRHCQPALSNFNVCTEWQSGNPCSKPNCTERHSNKHLATAQGAQKTAPNPEIPCRYNEYCTRPDCIYKHTGPRFMIDFPQRPYFPRPMSMTFRPRPQAGDEAGVNNQTTNGVPQQTLPAAGSAKSFASRPVQIRPPPAQKPQMRPTQFQPQVTNRPPAGKNQLQIAGLSQKMAQNTKPRPMQVQTQAQAPSVRPVRPVNKLRPMTERLSLPNGNKNVRPGAPNSANPPNPTKNIPARTEKSRLRPPPAIGQTRGMVKIKKFDAPSSKLGDPLTLEQIRAMKKATKEESPNKATEAVTLEQPTQTPATNDGSSAPIHAQAFKSAPAQKNADSSLKRAREVEDVPVTTQIPDASSNNNQIELNQDTQFDDFNDFKDLDFDYEQFETAPEPKKTRLENESTQAEATEQVQDQTSSNALNTSTNMDLDLGIDLDPEFLAQLSNY